MDGTASFISKIQDSMNEERFTSIIAEEITKTDVVKILKSDKEVEKKIKEIIRDVIKDMYRVLWQHNSIFQTLAH